MDILMLFNIILVICMVSEAQSRSTPLSPTITPSNGQYRQGRSGFYPDDRYGIPRTLIDDRRCSRCFQDRPYDIAGDHSEQYDRYDDRRLNPRPAYGGGGGRYEDERRPADKRNGTPNYEDNKRLRRPMDDRRLDDRRYDDRRYDDRRLDDRRFDDRNRYYDDYDAYPTKNRNDYYERFPSRDPYVDDYRRRNHDRFDDPYGRPLDPYDDYRSRPLYDGYGDYLGDRGNGYDDRGYGMRSKVPDRYDRYDRPWDETYRGVSGFDDAGRGYYFASGRPEYGGVSSGWHNVNEKPRNWRNPGWRDQSVNGDSSTGGARPTQETGYGQNSNYGSNGYAGGTSAGSNNPSASSSTTPGTSYLYQREDDRVTDKHDTSSGSTEKNKS